MRRLTNSTIPIPRAARPRAAVHVVSIPSCTPLAVLPPSETGADGGDPDLGYLWAEVRRAQPRTEAAVRRSLPRGELRFRYD